MENTVDTLYGDMARTPELKSGQDYLEHYALAYDLAQTLDITEDIDLTTLIIRNAVIKTLGPDVPAMEILAVSSLTAAAKERALRRPHAKNQKELSIEKFNFRPQTIFKSINKHRSLLKDQAHINNQQLACTVAQILFTVEADSLERDIL